MNTEEKLQVALENLREIRATLNQPVHQTTSGGATAQILRGDARSARMLAVRAIHAIEANRTEVELQCEIASAIENARETKMVWEVYPPASQLSLAVEMAETIGIRQSHDIRTDWVDPVDAAITASDAKEGSIVWRIRIRR